MVTYTENKKFAFIDGLRFCRDEKTGYYLNAKTHKRLHRYVYEKVNGAIPDGYHVHHIDHDKGNNEPNNLALMTGSQHLHLHGVEMTDEQREWRRNNVITKAVPAAKAWQGSAAGRAWHKIHYENMKDALHARKTKICIQCGREFEGLLANTNVFCSNACKSAWRRKAGVDDEQRVCIVCGKQFMVNRYSKAKCCSRSCGNRLQHKNRGHKTTPIPTSL